MELKDYIQHVDTWQCFDIVGLRELQGTFKREFQDATTHLEASE